MSDRTTEASEATETTLLAINGDVQSDGNGSVGSHSRCDEIGPRAACQAAFFAAIEPCDNAVSDWAAGMSPMECRGRLLCVVFSVAGFCAITAIVAVGLSYGNGHGGNATDHVSFSPRP